VSLTWQCYQQLRSIYHAGPTKGRAIAQKVLNSFTAAPSQRSPGSAAHSAPADTGTGLLRHLRRLQRRHRSHQPDHREGPPTSPRLQRF
jgi:hypothetical protein